MIVTTDHQFPRGAPNTAGQLVLALAAMMEEGITFAWPQYLKPVPRE